MANSDITRIEEITDMNLYVIFNDLTYQKELKDLDKYLNNK